MKGFIASTLAALVAAGGMMIASPEADAHGGRWHPRARVGIHIGAPVVYSPWWYHSRPYYYGYGPYPYGYPPVVVREEPTVYIEQNPPVVQAPAPVALQAAPQPQQQQYWYFCQDTQTYYPHVQNCTTPWQRVIPHAPTQPQ